MESHHYEVTLCISKPKIALLFWAYHLNESLYFLFARSELPWVEVLKVLPFTTSLEEHLKKDTRDSFYSSLTVPDHISCAHQREYILDNNSHGLYNGHIAEDTQTPRRQVSHCTIRVL